MSEGAAGRLDPAQVVQQASMLADVGRNDEALALVNRARGQHPDAPNLQITAAWLYLRLEQPAQALPILGALVAGQPDAPAPLYLLAVAQVGLGDLRAARTHADRALELDPENPRYHLQVAVVATAGKISNADRVLARSRILSALQLAPHDASLRKTGAELEWRMGDLNAALDLARGALSLEPDNPDLLYLESVIAGKVAESQTSNNSSTLWSTANQVAGMGNILGAAPTHAAAARLLYSRVWGQILKVTAAPHIPLMLLALTIGAAMGDGPTVQLLYIGATLAVVWPLFRLFVASVVLRRAPKGYVRREVRGGRGAVWRIAGSALAAAIALAGVACVLWVRDPVAVRLTLVALAVGSVVAGVASSAWFDRYLASARGSGILTDSPSGLEIAAAFRGALGRVVVWRVVIATLMSVLVLMISTSTRSDAAPVLAVGIVAWVAPVVYGLWRMRRLELQLRDGAEEAQPAAKGPGIVTGALLGLLVLALIGAGGAALAQVPWGPSERDQHSAYEPGLSGPSECQGRPATRLACIIERNQNPTPFPSFTVPDITVPDIEIPEFDPDIEVNEP